MRAQSRSQLYWLLSCALLVRLFVCAWAWGRVPPTADGAFYHVVAQRIADGQGYSWLWPDGVVTFAAHYPVGYPAAMAPFYFLFGAVPGVIMLVNAALGTAAVWATYRVGHFVMSRTVCHEYTQQAALGAAWLVAFCPTFVGYTPAVMTEGAVGALLIVALRIVTMRRSPSIWRRVGRVAALVFLLSGATYLRPQSVLFAPVLGWLAYRGSTLRRLGSSFLVAALTITCVLPWTMRNCEKMGRCVFVSANGGWNLLIGTFPEGKGGWTALEGEKVPVECRTVYQEADKDRCFAEAGARRVQERPGKWLALVPAKLRATVDHGALSAAHLRESGAFTERKSVPLSWLEIGWQRLVYVLVALGAWAQASVRPNNGPRSKRTSWFVLGLLALAIVGMCGLGAWWAWGVIALMWWTTNLRGDPVVVAGIFAVLSTLFVHAVFFGAGRYFLPAMILVAPLGSSGIAYIYTLLDRDRAGLIRNETGQDF